MTLTNYSSLVEPGNPHYPPLTLGEMVVKAMNQLNLV